MSIRDSLIGLGQLYTPERGLVKAERKEIARSASQGDEGQDRAPGGDNEDNVANAPMVEQKATQDPKTLFWDPFAIIEQLGFKDRPSLVTYGTLKSMVWKMPIIQAVIQTRVNQVAAFSTPAADRYQLGFQIRKRDAKDKNLNTTEEDWINQAQTFLCRTGVTDNPRGRDNFETFIRKVVWDSLVYDQLTFETVPNNEGQPAEFYAVDGATIRLADTATTYLDEDLTDATRYVQIYDGMVIAEYTNDEMFFGVRNPRTDIKLFGYGTSELEMLIPAVTSLLWSWQYNSKFFSQGSAAKGVLNFKGAIPDAQLRQFRRHWYELLSGVHNSWKTPITNADELQWINLQNNNRDMEFNAWMDFLIKVVCFTPETKTLKADGSLCRMDEVKPGDMVMTHMGRSGKVKNVQVTEHEGEVVCVKAGGEVVKATPEHPFYASFSRVNSWMCRDFEDPRWVKAEELVTAEDYLVVPKPQLPTDVESIDLRNYLEAGEYRDLGEDKISGNSNSSNVVPAVIDLTHDNAFALGLYVAEGCSVKANTTWTFHEDEAGYQDAVGAFLSRLGMTPSTVSVPDKHAVHVRGSSTAVVRAFQRMFGHKAPNKVIPQPIMEATEEAKWAFLSGLIAGDGCVPNTSRAGVELGTSSKALAEQVKTLCLSLGVWCSIYEYTRPNGFKAAGPALSVRISGSHLEKVGRFLSGAKGDSLREKLEQDRTEKPQSTVYETPAYFYIPIVEIWREPYQGKVYNIEVEGDHTYTAGWAAVHNCSMYSMNPVEVNFQYGNAGQKGALNEASNKEKITESRERGLRPLLRFLASAINTQLIWPLSEDFEFAFVGLDADTHEDIAKRNQIRVKTTMTVDELRAEDNLPPLPNGEGAILLDPTFLQARQAAQQQAAMEEQEAAGDGGGGEGDEDLDFGDVDFESLLAGDDEESGNTKPGEPAEPAEAAEAAKSMVYDIEL